MKVRHKWKEFLEKERCGRVNDKQSKHLIREETVREAGMLHVTVSPDAAPSSHSGCEPVYHPDGGSADSPPPA